MQETRRSIRRRERVANVVADLRTTTRSLSRRVGFSLSVLATLALALAGTAVTVTLVDAVLLKPLAYSGSEELVVARHPVPGFQEFGNTEWGLSVAGYFYFTDNTRSLEELGVWTGGNVNLAGEEGRNGRWPPSVRRRYCASWMRNHSSGGYS